jgi:hypothetical protein
MACNVFELGQSFGDGGLRNAQGFGSADQGAMFGNGHQCAQVTHFEAVIEGHRSSITCK